jgi:membrane protease YdiL (CAAX protease family)
MTEKNPSLKNVWIALSLPPVIFLLAIIVASIYFGAQGQTDSEQISQSVANSMSVILVVIQIAMLGVFLWAKRADQLSWREIGWQAAAGQKNWQEFLLGAAPGALLGLLYVFVLSPLMTAIQRSVGDYVPAGEILPSVGSGLLAFFIADVLLAPFVEENIYRGYALTRLFGRFSQPAAILISCVFFGLLHWAGGFWYILLTGAVAGGLFAALFVKRKNLIAPFAAHLALNLVEFLFVWLAR